jgi:hypothetical protein
MHLQYQNHVYAKLEMKDLFSYFLREGNYFYTGFGNWFEELPLQQKIFEVLAVESLKQFTFDK